MDELLSWFGTVFNFLGDWALEMFRQVKTIVSSFWGFIVILVGLLWTLLSHIVPMLTLVLRTLDDVVSGTWNLAVPSGVESILAVCNTFFPLDLLCQLAVSYATLRISLAIYRVVKSWLPVDGNT